MPNQMIDINRTQSVDLTLIQIAKIFDQHLVSYRHSVTSVKQSETHKKSEDVNFIVNLSQEKNVRPLASRYYPALKIIIRAEEINRGFR
jgi:hypothetical protein